MKFSKRVPKFIVKTAIAVLKLAAEHVEIDIKKKEVLIRFHKEF